MFMSGYYVYKVHKYTFLCAHGRKEQKKWRKYLRVYVTLKECIHIYIRRIPQQKINKRKLYMFMVEVGRQLNFFVGLFMSGGIIYFYVYNVCIMVGYILYMYVIVCTCIM